jgi:hypothetical protein
MQHTLTQGSGKRQKCLLLELEKQAIICHNKENGLWMRGALSCRLAKDLLLPTDKTIDEQIKELEPSVLRLEKEAERIGAKLNGYARQKLNKLYEQKKEIYVCFG